MKCIKFPDGKITRISDSLAEKKVRNDECVYTNKTNWKMYDGRIKIEPDKKNKK